MAEKKSFRDTILIVFVVLVCFGLTIYGIVFLLGLSKVSSPDAPETITNEFVTPKVITDPNDGVVMSFTDNATVATDNNTDVVAPTQTPTVRATEPERKQPVVEKKPEAKPAVKQESKKAANKEDAKPAAKKPVAQPAKKEATKAKELDKEPEQVALATSNASGKFVLQLMALRSETDAYKAMDKYKPTCPDIYVTKVDIKDSGVWYRVRCGVTDSMDEAIVLKQRFATDYKVNADIIKNQK